MSSRRVRTLTRHLQPTPTASAPVKNRRIVVKSTPEAEPGPEHFNVVEEDLGSLKEGQMLLRTLWCSVDPYMRTVEGIANPEIIGKTMIGGTVSEVVVSHAEGWHKGDLVVGYYGWQEYVVANSSDVQWFNSSIPIEKWDLSLGTPSAALGVLGMTGYTAYFGLLEVGQPQAGDTVVVSAASGAVGQVVGQIAKLLGCYVVGIAGGSMKCSFCVEQLGFDACVDYKESELPRRLSDACPKGIDVYFENVGGDVLEAVLPLLNPGCRVPVCGFISQYNSWDNMTHPPPMQRLAECGIKKKSKKDQGPGFRFFFWMEPAFLPKRREALQRLSQWIKEGKIKYRESVTQGLDSMIGAFSGMLRGENFGKTVIKIT